MNALQLRELVHQSPPIVQATMSDQVYGWLRDAILSRRLGPGERVDLDGLARALSVSKTPLMLAVHRLANEGLMRIRPRHGTFVATFNTQDVNELFDLRLLLERHAAGCTAGRPSEAELTRLRACVEQMAHLRPERSPVEWGAQDMHFHSLLVERAGNQRLVDIYTGIIGQIQAVRLYYQGPITPGPVVAREHAAMLAACAQGTNEALARLLEGHIERSRRSALALLAGEAAGTAGAPSAVEGGAELAGLSAQGLVSDA